MLHLTGTGLKLERGPVAENDNGDSKGGEVPLQSGFGVIWDENKPGMIIKAVLTGSSGAGAGLMPGR